MSESLWIQIIAYAVSIGCVYGGISARLKSLEKKVDKHNNVIERMYKAEGRIDTLERHLADEEKELEELKHEQRTTK